MGEQSTRRDRDAVCARPRRAAPPPQARTTRALEVAERNAEAAAARYRELRAAALSGPAQRRSLRSWQQLLLLVVGGGVMVGVLGLWLLATMYLGYVALIVLPAVVGLAALVVVRSREAAAVRHPCVEDLVRAMRELREAEAAVRRAQVRDGTAAASPEVTPQPGARTAQSSTTRPGPASC